MLTGPIRSLSALVSTRAEWDHVAGIYAPIAIAVFALVLVACLFAVLRYRARAPERTSRRHENNPLEGAYAALLVGIVAFLLYVTFGAEHQIDTVAAHERPGLVVDVTGAKWEWRFSYPAYRISRYSGTVGHQSLVVPIDTPILFRLRSIDVIHSFWVTELDFKRDLIPGAINTAVLTFTRVGSFPGRCSEFCGLLHYAMTFTVDAVRPSAFRVWARTEQARGGEGPAGATAPLAGSSS